MMRQPNNFDKYNIWKKSNKGKSWQSFIQEQIESGNKTLDHRQYKKYLIGKYGAVCFECSWAEKNPITNKVTVELNHKDGNADNNELENLELLCPNCHSLTPTYKNLNRGRGRKERREIYRIGRANVA